MVLIETREEIKMTIYCVSHLCILEYCSTHSIKINYIFKVYEEPVEIVPEEEEPVPVVEEEEPVPVVEEEEPVPVVEEEEPVPVVEEVEPEAPPPAGTRQDSLNGRGTRPTLKTVKSGKLINSITCTFWRRRLYFLRNRDGWFLLQDRFLWYLWHLKERVSFTSG